MEHAKTWLPSVFDICHKSTFKQFFLNKNLMQIDILVPNYLKE